MTDAREEWKTPKGVYKVTLYGIGGAKLYEAYYPAYTGFRYVVPSMYREGLQVTGFNIEWQE